MGNNNETADSFYSVQIGKLNNNHEINDSELLKLQIQKELLKLQIELERLRRGESIKSIETTNNKIDFEITGGYIKKEVYEVKLRKGWIPDAEKKIKRYAIGDSQIIESSKGKNMYIINIKSADNRIRKTINVKYNGGNTIHIYDSSGRYSETISIQSKNKRNHKGTIEIKTNKGKIVLFLDLSRKHHSHLF